MRKSRIARGIFFFVVFLWGRLSSHAQAYDKIWAVGTPIATITFDTNTVTVGSLFDTAYSFVTIGSICDVHGNLQFCTNGKTVFDSQGHRMLNGDSLSYPSRWYSQLGEGMAGMQGALILPDLSDTNKYYIFHYTSTDTIIPGGGGYEALNFYYSLVDMTLDGGKGGLSSKNVPLIQNELLSAARLSACKHANGRDWWIIKNAWRENIYYKFLLTPYGIQGPFIQQIGPKYGNIVEQAAYSVFSPDGSKYISFTALSHIVLMDFDRCTGLFSNPDSFYNNASTDPVHSPHSGGISGAFSPSGRFFYITNRLELNQYDLWSSHIQDSVRIQTLTDSNDHYQLDILQLAPNGKIYISCWNGGSYNMHVINQPDSLGLACDFHMYGQPTLSQSPVAIPYFPNYRLEALLGACDTLTALDDIQAAHPAFAMLTPNPASDYAEIIYYTAANTSNNAELYDVTGKLLWSENRIGSNGNMRINVSALPDGIYLVKFAADNKELLRTKLVVSR